MTHVAGTESAEAALMSAFYGEHTAGLWRYAMRSTGHARRAKDAHGTLLRAWQHPDVVGDPDRGVGRFDTLVSSLDDSNSLGRTTLGEVNATQG